ncbi:unnamed protein product [Symbiodinium natans]|uniref:Uncharacterized protein n=1 Tax=Symbiodinium natans TaxID=878477 RepID=A0A812I416_9DINO|nr:unnamed protein product [Symbiodinium natans]
MASQPEQMSWKEAFDQMQGMKTLVPVIVGVIATLLLPFVIKLAYGTFGMISWAVMKLGTGLSGCVDALASWYKRGRDAQRARSRDAPTAPQDETQPGRILRDYLIPLHDLTLSMADKYMDPILDKTENVKTLLTNLLHTFQDADFKASLSAMTTQLEGFKNHLLSEIKQQFQDAELKTKFSALTESVKNKILADIKQGLQEVTKQIAGQQDLTAKFEAVKAQIEEVRIKLVAAMQLAAQEIKQLVQPLQSASTGSASSPSIKECQDEIAKLSQALHSMQDQHLQLQADIKLLNSRVSQGVDKISSEAASSYGTLNSQVKGNHSYMKGMKESLDSILHRTDAQEPRGWQVKHVEDMNKFGFLLAEIKDVMGDLTERVDGLETSLVNLTGKLGRQESQTLAREQKWDSIHDVLKEMLGRLGRQESQTSANEQKWDAIFDVLKEMLDRMAVRQVRTPGQYPSPTPDPRIADMMTSAPTPGGLPGIRPIRLAPLVNQPYPPIQQGPVAPQGPMTPAQRAEALRAALDFLRRHPDSNCWLSLWTLQSSKEAQRRGARKWPLHAYLAGLGL